MLIYEPHAITLLWVCVTLVLLSQAKKRQVAIVSIIDLTWQESKSGPFAQKGCALPIRQPPPCEVQISLLNPSL